VPPSSANASAFVNQSSKADEKKRTRPDEPADGEPQSKRGKADGKADSDEEMEIDDEE
jgi:hypothetical protein